MSRVIHTAQALVDVVLAVPRWPGRGGNVMADDVAEHAGGAVSILVAAARSGARAVHAGSVGTGPRAEIIRAALEADGVEISSPPVTGTDTGICIVLVEPDGERTFVTTRGAERRISVESLATANPGPDDLVCVSGYSLHPPTRDPLLAWLETLPAEGTVVLDPGASFAGFDERVRTRMLAHTDLWTSNDAEVTALTGQSDPDRACAALAAMLPGPGAVVVVREGDRGCRVRVDGTTTVVAGFPQEAVDTNGAGDAHTGVLCAERAAGTDWPEACRRANAAAAIKVTRRGPATAPGRAEVDVFLDEWTTSANLSGRAGR